MTHTLRVLTVAAVALIGLATECGVHTGPSSADDGEIPLIVGDPHDLETWVEDEYTIREARVVGDQLEMTVTFGGGCEDHDFRLIHDKAFMESDPVQLAVLDRKSVV